MSSTTAALRPAVLRRMSSPPDEPPMATALGVRGVFGVLGVCLPAESIKPPTLFMLITRVSCHPLLYAQAARGTGQARPSLHGRRPSPSSGPPVRSRDRSVGESKSGCKTIRLPLAGIQAEERWEHGLGMGFEDGWRVMAARLNLVFIAIYKAGAAKSSTRPATPR